MISEPDGDDALRSALMAEKPLVEETIAALCHIFALASKEPASEKGPSLGNPHVRAGEAAISVLVERMDYETLLKLAGCSSIPGRPLWLAQRCIDAMVRAGEKNYLYDLASDELDCEAQEPFRSVRLTNAAKLLLRLGEEQFVPAYLTLGDLFKNGIGFPKDLEQAGMWYLKAAFVNSFEASNRAVSAASAYQELIEICETYKDSHVTTNNVEFYRLQIGLAHEFSKRIRAVLPQQGVDCLIDKGESGRTEFKSTLRWDIKKRMVNSDLEKQLIQQMAAFMNLDGGNVLIGVADDKTIFGLEADYGSFSAEKDRNRNGFERHLRQILRNALCGRSQMYSINFYPFEAKDVCQITVRRSPEPVFVKGEDKRLWVRDGNSKRALSGNELEEYCREHWPV